jgi:hypothetical protein
MDDFYRRHLNRIANSDEARGLMQMISVAVDAYSDYFARYGVTAIIELKRPINPSDNPSRIGLFADWRTARHKLRVAVDEDPEAD